MPIGRSDYEDRKEEKIERLEEKVTKAEREAETQGRRSRDIGNAIPFGQPILVGHHSERRHRADVDKIEAAINKSIEASEKAAYYQGKADTAANNRSISGDNPEAVKLYREKLAKLEAGQERMKAVNKAWKSGANALHALGLTDENIEKLKAGMSSYETKPYPAWALSNNNAEIRRIKEKLESLAKLDGMAAELVKFPGGEMRIDIDINRVQFIFDDIPSQEIRTQLKSFGFKWARSEGAWQRQRTENAVHVAKRLLSKFSEGGENV